MSRAGRLWWRQVHATTDGTTVIKTLETTNRDGDPIGALVVLGLKVTARAGTYRIYWRDTATPANDHDLVPTSATDEFINFSQAYGKNDLTGDNNSDQQKCDLVLVTAGGADISVWIHGTEVAGKYPSNG